MNINDFGRNSFVSHTTGLIERIEKMTEHLFKLKKDKKTVGYLQISEEVDTLSTTDPMAVYIKKVDSEWRTYEFDCGREYKVIFDAAHPFVTKDKHGKDVFADDRVKVYFGELPSTLTAKAKIIYSHCQFMASGIEEDNNKGPWSLDSKHIELIEDKE